MSDPSARRQEVRSIRGPACVAEGAAWLSENVAEFARILPALQPLPLRLRAAGFEALADAIIGQQISTHAASAIAARMRAAGLMCEDAIEAASDDALRAAGQSAQKIRYLRALASARLDYAALHDMDTEAVLQRLTALPGIGPWTAEIYAMFSLGHADVFPAGDLALQEAAREVFGLERRPDPKTMRQIAEAFRPWRAVAARALWAYYKTMTRRDGIR